MRDRSHIDFQHIGIAEVLRRYRLQVPANQREYSWEDVEVKTLFEDLQKAIADTESEYFLGTVVTIPHDDSALQVVDGQQRLATTALLLTQIRNYLWETEKLIAERIDNVFLSEIDARKRERIPKLTLNIDDNQYFQAVIRGDGSTTPSQHSHRLINAAFDEAGRRVQQIVAGFDKKDHGDALNTWVEFLEQNARVILLTVPTGANAYKMFETLNDRGQKTSQADLVKNYLFGQSGNRINEAQQKWARMRNSLESLNEDEDITVTFLRQAMIVIRGHLRESDVYEAVQKRAKGSQSSVQFLSSLDNLAAIYVSLFNPEHERWNSYPDAIRRAIQALNLLNIRTIRPLMLGIASQFQPQEASNAFRFLISLGVRLLIASSTSRGSVEEPLANAGHKVFSGAISNVTRLKKELADILPADVEFRTAFETATVSKAALARYYLRSLEMAAKNEATPWFIPNDDKQTINLEHVLPESPEGNWPQFDEETARFYTKRIGNLALLLAKSNSDLKSADFIVKKKIYKTSPYELTRQIADASSWGPEQITKRQKGLAEFAVKAWPL